MSVGVAGVAAALLLIPAAPRDALTGWLAAAAFIAGLPAGALILLLMMALVTGRWVEDLRGPARLVGSVWPLAAAAFVPVLIGMAAIYPWFGAPPRSPFAGLWLNPAFFALRTVAWFGFGWLAARQASTRIGEGAASVLLIATVLGDNFVASDWLMTLDPKLASSGFGLQIIALDACSALAAMIVLRLAGGRPRNPGVLGGLLLTVLLMWAYLQFMPFLIIWAGNLAQPVGWYVRRESLGPVAALAAAAILGGAPLFALLSAQVRNSPHRLGLCAALVLVGKAIEFAWFALPGRGYVAVVAWLLALAGLGCLAVATALRAARLAEARL